MIKVYKTHFKDLLIIKHNISKDNRGFFKEVFKKNIIESQLGYELNFCQENNVKSSFMVLRGMHFQVEPFSQSKLISVTKGKILDISVDIRPNSKTYGQYFSHILSENSHESIFIPKGFAHGYLTLSDIANISYKVDNYYNRNAERGISFRDKFLKIDWGHENNLFKISKKDLKYIDYEW